MPADAGPAEDSNPDDVQLMRENVLELARNPMAGNRVSLEYLKADLYRRAEALKDVPDAPLFFGRLDYSELAEEVAVRRHHELVDSGHAG